MNQYLKMFFNVAMLVLAAIVLGSACPRVAVAQDNNDFEVVEAGQKSNSRSVTNNQQVRPVSSPTPTDKTQNKRSKTRGVADVQNAQVSVTGNLPLKVEVTDLQPNALITLAVGAATRFHAQEKPTRLVIGNLTDIGVTKAGAVGWYGFYLRPVTGGITTNMFIEFESGATVMINLRTVNPKTLRPGDYNSEVFVKTAGMRDELKNLRENNEKLRRENEQLRSEASAAAQKLVEKVVPVGISDAELFQFLERTFPVIKRDRTFWKDFEVDKINVTALTPLWELKPGVGYILFEAENKNKQPVIIQNLTLMGGTGQITKSINDLTIQPSKTIRFALKIEVSGRENNPLQIRFTTGSGKFFDQILSNFAVNIKQVSEQTEKSK